LADDELNQTQNQNLPKVEELEQGQASAARIVELEGLVAQKDEELAKANACIIELEQAVASKGSENATLNQSIAESEEKLTTINNSLDEAIASYKALVVQSNPEVFEELVSGDTIQTINESLRKAKTLVSKVRQGLEVEVASARIPAGAPQRTPPDLSALSPREKIQYAIGGKK